ncbi:uncharacterized protein LOC131220836 [Magnolia sinica]|uniref:uncharacterized protein LOC131220836 n=1 Tax=Magnolia sinica TaxID=86752 RepID=UPI0026586EF5|nr:uncharacterized protein LOC131220836 [Magnolia sinica]
MVKGRMGSTAVEKTTKELRKEIEELHRQQWEITERLRDPRGIRSARLTANGPRNFGGPNGVRRRGLIRPVDRVDFEDQSALKRRLSSTVVKVEEGELTEDAAGAKAAKEPDLTTEGGPAAMEATDRRAFDLQLHDSFRRDGNQRELRMMDVEAQPTEHVPRVLPKDKDPSLVKRNRRMLGQLLGILEVIRSNYAAIFDVFYIS